jgi:hypothetical protein
MAKLLCPIMDATLVYHKLTLSPSLLKPFFTKNNRTAGLLAETKKKKKTVMNT